jgi:hypothetical protein
VCMGTFYLPASLSASDFKELAGRTQGSHNHVRDPSVSPSWVFCNEPLPLPPELSMTLRMWPPWLSFERRFLSFLVLDFRLQGRKKGLNLIHFLTWRKTRTKNLKTTEFLEICGRVLSLTFSRYVSDSIWTIFKISWRGIYAKSFRVRQSSVDNRLVDFLENRNAFLLLLVEICASFFSFSGRARTSTLSVFAFHSHESFRVFEYDFIATRCR